MLSLCGLQSTYQDRDLIQLDNAPMGRDLTLYPRKASKQALKVYLECLGFQKCKHLWNWPAGTLNYSWFDEEDFRSIDGVSADVYPVSGDELQVTRNEWALHVRNLYSASWHDVSMLNNVLRGARKRFGGTIRGDYGTNRYAPLWKDDSTPISRGVAAIYQRVDQELSAVKFALPEPSMQSPTSKDMDAKMRDFVELTKSSDPSRVIYNGLVPFAVSMFEYFFSRVFRVLITYDEFACKKKESHNLRVNFSTLLEVSNRERTVEDVIAEAYTFQNLDRLNKAYKDWLNIDVRKILFKKKRIGRSVGFLESRIAEIIQYRHGVVHDFEIDRSLTRDGYIAILDAIETAIKEFLAFLERKIHYNYRSALDDHRPYSTATRIVSHTFDSIRTLISEGGVRISEYGYEELAADGLLARERVEGVKAAEVIEDYPSYPKGPCVLLLQRTKGGRSVGAV